MITHIHHINFLVKDLDQAVSRYQALFNGRQFIRDTLESRAVKTARIKLGHAWLILVQPLDDTSEPARYLARHGEGFFLLSLASDDFDAEQQRIETHNDLAFSTPVRTGLDGWRVRDLDMQKMFGTQLQLTQE